MKIQALFRSFAKPKNFYAVKPPWAAPIDRDPFDYKLRTIEEVKNELKN